MSPRPRSLGALGFLLLLGWGADALAQPPIGVQLAQPAGPLSVAAPTGASTLTQPLHPTPTFCNAASEAISQSIADNFLVTDPQFAIDEIVVWGIFFLDNTPGTDEYSVLFHVDSAGLPGSLALAPYASVPASRVDTGLDFAGKDIYEFTMLLDPPATLAPGTYWVELFNDASSQSDDFCWIQGSTDATHGIPGHVFSTSTPGVTWQPQGDEMAVLLNGAAVPVELQGWSVD